MSFAKAIKTDFTPFLPLAIPHTLKIASYLPTRFSPNGKLGHSLVEDESNSEEELDEWGDIPDLYDKAGAMTALAVFGSECGKGMKGWVEVGMGLGVEGLKSPSRGVRTVSTRSITDIAFRAKGNR